MSTRAQRAANRRNAQSAAGPVTDAGKIASSQNARKHGLASGFCILPTEDPNEFNELLDRINVEMMPTTEHECFLVDQMIQARWKLERIRGIEEGLLEKVLAGESLDNQLNLMMRYSASAERSYYKAHKEFMQSRREGEKAGQAAFKESVDNYLAPPPGHAKAVIAAPHNPGLGLFGKTGLSVAAMPATLEKLLV